MTTRAPRKQRYKPFVPTTRVPTERELEVLQGIADGLRNRQIGARLFVTENTVKCHGRRLFARIGATSRCQAVRIGFERKWLHPDKPDPSELVELREREQKLLDLISQGLTYPKIAERMFRDADYVKHLSHAMFREIDAVNRAHAVRRGFDLGLLRLGGDAS